MAIALKLDTTTGQLARFVAADSIDVQSVTARNTAAALTIGSNLDAGQEVQIGTTTADTRILGDLFVDGASTVTVSETITGNFEVQGDTNLGIAGGDTINLGASGAGAGTDTINLNSDLVLGVGTRTIGSSVTDYADQIWLDAVNTNGPNLAAYDLNASGTNAGAYAIGVDPALITSSTATDLMTMLVDMDTAISSGASSLQATYQTGNTIDVTSAEGTIDFANDTTADTTTVLTVSRTPASSTGGNALDLSMGANTTGIGLNLTAAGSGDALFVNNTGTGDAIDIQDGGTSVLQVTAAGAMNLTPTSGQTLTMTVAGAGTIDMNAAGAVTVDSTAAGISLDAAGASNFTTTTGDLTVNTTGGTLVLAGSTAVTIDSSGGGISLDGAGASNFSTSAGNITIDAAAAELVFDDVGNSGLTLSDSTDRVLDQAASGEIFNGTTSIIGALSDVARRLEVEGGPFTFEEAIENTVTIAAGDCVAASTTAGRVTQANANANTNSRFVGIAIVGGTGDAGGTVIGRVATEGSLVTDTGATFTAGQALFLPDGTGRPTATAPANTGDVVQRVGWALTATQYVIDSGPAVIL